MFRKTIFIFSLLFILGFGLTWGLLLKFSSLGSFPLKELEVSLGLHPHQVIGFLPYWLVDRAQKDYSASITTLTYFSLTISPDGSLKKYDKPGEAEPGWYTLDSGKLDSYFSTAKAKKMALSLLVFNGNKDEIAELISDPASHAAILVEEVSPLMQKYGFSDLNLDIENISDASSSARDNFTQFVSEVRSNMRLRNLGTLTLEVSPTDLVRPRLMDMPSLAKIVDSVVLMAYDFHYAGSQVTGPVAPIGGFGSVAEFDTRVAVQKLLETIPPSQVVLGVPLYGYEWESQSQTPRSATLPGSGQVISGRRVEELLQGCATCSAQWDPLADEEYLIYRDSETGTYHQAFFPSVRAMSEKINFSNEYSLSGIALWALGYESSDLLTPLVSYKQTFQ